MAPRAVAFALAALFLRSVVSVQPKELEDWLASANGLAMSRPDAAALASREWQTLTQCGVTIQTLADLKKAMYDPSGMDMPLKDVRSQILLLAEQHASPQDMLSLFDVLHSAYSKGSVALGLPLADAQAHAVDLVRRRTDADQLQALYKVMRNPAFRFDKATSQTLALKLAPAGADPGKFLATYSRTRSLDEATSDAIVGNLDGLVRRYAKDAKAYSAAEFLQYYPGTFLQEWLDAPMEQRVADDRRAYTAGEFAKHYGATGWHSKFVGAAEATQERLAPDGKAYRISEFQAHYADTWQQRWANAPELPCAECSPYAEEGGANIVI